MSNNQGNKSGNRFENLVKESSEEEKQGLLTQIEQLDLPNPEDNDYVVEQPIQPKRMVIAEDDMMKSAEFQAYMKKRISQFSFFDSLIFKMQVFFFQKNPSQMICSLALGELRHEISGAGNFIHFDNRMLSVKFAAEVFELYRVIAPFRMIFTHLWQDKFALHRVISSLLGLTMTNPKKEMADFLTMDQMLFTFIESGHNEESVRRALLKSIKTYTDSLPLSRMKELREELLPLYFLNGLINYPFDEFFSLCGFSLNSITDGQLPIFKSAPFAVVLEHLTQLTGVFMWASHVTCSEDVVRAMLVEYLVSGDVELSPKALNSQLSELNKAFHTMIDKINRASTSLPLLPITRYIMGNPIFETKQTIPRLDVRLFYANTFKKMAQQEFETILVQVRIAFIEKTVSDLFGTMTLTKSDFYTDELSSSWNKLKLPMFRHTNSFMLTSNFMKKWFTVQLKPLIDALVGPILTKFPALKSGLEEIKISIDLAEDRLRRFEIGLTPESVAGKQLSLFKATATAENKRTKEISTFMIQKDLEAYMAIQDVLSNLEKLTKFLGGKILNSSNETLKPAIAGVYASIHRSQSLHEVLSVRLKDTETFLSMVVELLRHEQSGIAANLSKINTDPTTLK